MGIPELTPTIVNEFVKKSSSMLPINPADTGYRRYRLCLILSVNLSRRTSLSPIKKKSRGTISNPAEFLPYEPTPKLQVFYSEVCHRTEVQNDLEAILFFDF